MHKPDWWNDMHTIVHTSSGADWQVSGWVIFWVIFLVFLAIPSGGSGSKKD